MNGPQQNDRTSYLHLDYGPDQSENRNLRILDNALYQIVIGQLATLIPPATITEAMLAKPSVGTPELFPLSVTSAILASQAVQTANIQDGAVTNAKITSVDWTKLTSIPPQISGIPPF